MTARDFGRCRSARTAGSSHAGSPSPAHAAGSTDRPGGARRHPERRELFADFVSAGELERRRVAESIHDDSIQVIAAMGMRLQMLRRAIDDPDQLGLLDGGRAGRAALDLPPPPSRLRAASAGPRAGGSRGRAGARARCDRARLRHRVPAGRPVLVAARDAAVGDPLPHHPGSPRQRAGARAREQRHRDAAGARRRPCGARRRRRMRVRDGARAAGGEGYGFASMRARVRLGGGTLRVESAPGTGTTVEAWLPRRQTPGAQRVPA